jgi:hypothetical protein
MDSLMIESVIDRVLVVILSGLIDPSPNYALEHHYFILALLNYLYYLYYLAP